MTQTISIPTQRPFLKWAGNKAKLIPTLKPLLESDAKTLIEAFVGSGALFLNTNYPTNVLCDSNPDLINLYRVLREGKDFISTCKKLFTKTGNTAETFYKLR